jgi:pectate lyase
MARAPRAIIMPPRASLLVVVLAACSTARVRNEPAPADARADANLLDGAQQDPFNVFADASGTVEVFINGVAVGKTSAPGEVLALAAPLVAGENVVVLRARAGGNATPAAHAQIGGAFGTAGTSARWKAKLATGGEATEPIGAWATLVYDDSAWPAATNVGRVPQPGFPTDGPARGVWTASPGDATVLLRLVLFVPPDRSADRPVGFGHAVTGGAGGEVVTVTTPAELAAAVSGSTPRVIQIATVIDFTGLDGPATAMGCYQRVCPAPTPSQLRLDFNGFCASTGQTPFSITFDKAGRTPLLVGSNKTIVGIGAGATVRGKGFKIAGARNVVVRNLTITDINPQVIFGGDAIHLDDADGVWIDHVRFSLINRQMLVTGMGSATDVTVSWNEFDGRTPYSAKCNGTHYWVMLIVGAQNTITVNDNWIHHTSGRAPESGGYGSVASLHFVNDYYDYVPGIAANPYTTSSKYLYEGTYFRNVDHPVLPDATVAPAPGLAYVPLASTIGSTTAACEAALGRRCVANIAAPQNGEFPLAPSVLGQFDGATITPYPAAEVPKVVPHLAGPGHL